MRQNIFRTGFFRWYLGFGGLVGLGYTYICFIFLVFLFIFAKVMLIFLFLILLLQGMLWTMLIFWLSHGKPIYPSMSPHQSIPYISDIGADILKPLFIVGTLVTGSTFFFSLAAVRRNHSFQRRLENVLDALSTVAGFVGASCLVLLAAFDTMRYSSAHRGFLLGFMMGIVISAAFTGGEFGRLSSSAAASAASVTGNKGAAKEAEAPTALLVVSYRSKLVLVFIEVVLSFAFGATMYGKLNNQAAVLEWCKWFFPSLTPVFFFVVVMVGF
jgi:hypothetical protein